MPDNLPRMISERLEDIVEIMAVFSSKNEIILKGALKADLIVVDQEIISRLTELKLYVEILSTHPYLLLRLRKSVSKKRKFPWINLLLFLVTVVTTIFTGALWEGVDWIGNPIILIKNPFAVISGGLPFSLSLLAILGFHEFGHYFASRYHRVNVTLPYFIPAPPGIIPFGTLGTVIKSKSPFINKKQLLDVGAAGPLAGLAISIIVLTIGINDSTVQPMTENVAGIFFGESILFRFITFISKGPIGPDYLLSINSVALAGWVGLLVTMFNLIPMGQLDGGHIAYAMFGKYQKIIAIMVFAGLALLSFYWSGWIFWLIIGLFLRLKHPPTVMDEIPLGAGRTITGYLCFAVFILCFIPAPISIIMQ